MKVAPIILAVAIGLPCVAAANPTRLAMQWEEGETIHLADQAGAINRHRTARVNLELLAGGNLVGSDTGKRIEHNLYTTHSTDDETTWTNTWSGTWSTSGDSLHLNLVLADRRCRRIRTTTGAAPETLACDRVNPQVILVCSTDWANLSESIDDPAKKRKLETWRCAPKEAPTLTDTPFPWMFGKTRCLKTSGGQRTDTSYRKCTP